MFINKNGMKYDIDNQIYGGVSFVLFEYVYSSYKNKLAKQQKGFCLFFKIVFFLLSFLLAYVSMLFDVTNIILVSGAICFEIFDNFCYNYITHEIDDKNKKNTFLPYFWYYYGLFKHVLFLIVFFFVYFCMFFIVAFVDLKYMRSRHSTRVDKYDYTLRNIFVDNYSSYIEKNTNVDKNQIKNSFFTNLGETESDLSTDSVINRREKLQKENKELKKYAENTSKILSETHKYIMDRSEVNLLNIRHLYSFKNLIVEKIHENTDIEEEDRYIKYGDHCKIYRYTSVDENNSGSRKEYLSLFEEKDQSDKFLLSKWISDGDDAKTMFVFEKLENLSEKESDFVVSRIPFRIKHINTNEYLCLKYDMELYWSVNARKISYQFMFEINENHPYYLKHFTDNKCRENKKYYLWNDYVIENKTKSFRFMFKYLCGLIKVLSFYFKFIIQHKNNIYVMLMILLIIFVHVFICLLNLRFTALFSLDLFDFIRDHELTTNFFKLCLFLVSILCNGLNVYTSFYMIGLYVTRLYNVYTNKRYSLKK